ncbi:hypothetical protein FPOA_00709 [Fusarium poae]|uniref:Uncharacterized protein n=1 Tax=Fusarium poae TaxID=36050 RepID=A0A1B8B220_FUSPO|nr:hypothetical protein FPOA_00709 [Fusarium poae]
MGEDNSRGNPSYGGDGDHEDDPKAPNPPRNLGHDDFGTSDVGSRLLENTDLEARLDIVEEQQAAEEEQRTHLAQRIARVQTENSNDVGALRMKIARLNNKLDKATKTQAEHAGVNNEKFERLTKERIELATRESKNSPKEFSKQNKTIESLTEDIEEAEQNAIDREEDLARACEKRYHQAIESIEMAQEDAAGLRLGISDWAWEHSDDEMLGILCERLDAVEEKLNTIKRTLVSDKSQTELTRSQPSSTVEHQAAQCHHTNQRATPRPLQERDQRSSKTRH